ncbi:MAG: HupE/UreJ family protein [Myxococcales bacterium]|nr:HupE/UreJ family protein [Myxococcales bacterium]
MTRRRVVCAALVALAIARAAPAAGHGFDPALLDLRALGGGRYAVFWKAAPTADDLRPRFPDRCIAEGSAGATLTGEGSASWIVACDGNGNGLAALEITVDELAAARTDVVWRFTPKDGETITGVLRADQPSFTVQGGAPGAQRSSPLAVSYLRLGFAHILGGFDHLLFIVGLLLLARRAGPLLRAITAFTVAHSITLALTVLGALRLPPPPVEAAIALSLVLLAVELTRTSRARRPFAIAFAFGLLHGCGFAGALAAYGLPEGRIPVALAAFNAGVEIGQIAFVAAILAGWALVRAVRRRIPRLPSLPRLAPAYAIGTLAVFWSCQRIAAFWS